VRQARIYADSCDWQINCKVSISAPRRPLPNQFERRLIGHAAIVPGIAVTLTSKVAGAERT
jgi:hypothetical protein